MVSTVVFVITVVVVAVVVFFLAYMLSKSRFEKEAAAKVGSAEDRARAIIDDAVKAAESKKREALLEVKEESIKCLVKWLPINPSPPVITTDLIWQVLPGTPRSVSSCMHGYLHLRSNTLSTQLP